MTAHRPAPVRIDSARSTLVGPRTSVVARHDLGPCGPTDVVLRTLLCGVCASDLPEWNHPDPAQLPVAMGHEPVATVADVGAEVRGLAEGDLVTGRLEPGFAEFLVAPAVDVVKVPDGLSPDQAVGEPLGCVVEGLRQATVDVGDRVAVVGAGYMGLILVQLLRWTPVAEIVVYDPRPDARESATRNGADRAHDPGEYDAPASARSGFDAVFEVSGSQPGLDLSTKLLRQGGTLTILGFHQSGPREVDLRTWNWKAVRVLNAHIRDGGRMADNIRRGLDVAASGRLDLGRLITHRFALNQLDGAFEALETKPAGFVKAVIDFRRP